MYIPKHFENSDTKEILRFIQKYSFGTIVTAQNNVPFATHMPFAIEMEGDDIVLTTHIAKNNPQAEQLLNNEVMVIFSEPHAYVSPKHYEKEQSVPTWNYMAVHAYGRATIIDDADTALALLEKMIRQYDLGYLKQWDGLPMEYKTKMLKGIVVFGIRVTSLQAKNKLSQNRSETERRNIIEALEKSADGNEVAIAKYMKATK
ncbi:transcriptional regulator [Mucilaginibacter sp. PPCGB 2223]|uniref:FMN-binding negative transcriptional regulator n=1 Tax=Mucilaginibacter sp. PPCGB 2223 TaxID=1886027 RepID=UPI0008259289|nr:FMN-binding negative transcriptional regulator [Mucilaginibacter sp. PPCGB 2223]OCX53986.1 transcriptional regulator [Mucilaginibacter sp. PPCGB 2223]